MALWLVPCLKYVLCALSCGHVVLLRLELMIGVGSPRQSFSLLSQDTSELLSERAKLIVIMYNITNHQHSVQISAN